jgi:hypothetical protein
MRCATSNNVISTFLKVFVSSSNSSLVLALSITAVEKLSSRQPGYGGPMDERKLRTAPGQAASKWGYNQAPALGESFKGGLCVIRFIAPVAGQRLLTLKGPGGASSV